MIDTETLTKESFLESLAAYDNGAPEPVEKVESTEVAETPEPVEPAAKPAKTEPTKANQNQPDGSKPTEPSVRQKPDDAAKPAKSKWAQNEERKAKTWEQINADRAALAAEKEAVAKARQEIEAARNKATADQPYRDEHGNTAANYSDAAKKLRENGDTANADAADQLAATLAQRETQVRQQHAQQEFQTKWSANYAAQCEKHAALKDPASDLYKETLRIVNELPQFRMEPEGINAAVQAAQILIASRDTENTKAENAKLKAQLEQLNKKLSIGGGAPTSPPSGPKDFASMSQKERKKDLMDRLLSDDRDAGFADD